MPGTCTICSEPATLLCPKCKDTTECSLTASTTIYYCSQECQTADWSTHQHKCIDKNGSAMPVLALKRAASILHSIFLHHRENIFEDLLVRIDDSHPGVLTVHTRTDKRSQLVCETGRIYQFADWLCKDDEQKEAILTSHMCMDSWLMTSQIANRLLENLCNDIIWMNVKVKNVRLSVDWFVDGQHDAETTYAHDVLAVQLTTGDWYVIDLTVAQYGWHEIVLPLEVFLRDRCARINRKEPLDNMLPSLSHEMSARGSIGDAIFRYCNQVNTLFQQAFVSHIQRNGIEATRLLRGTPQEFQIEKGKILEIAKKQIIIAAKIVDPNWLNILTTAEAERRELSRRHTEALQRWSLPSVE